MNPTCPLDFQRMNQLKDLSSCTSEFSKVLMMQEPSQASVLLARQRAVLLLAKSYNTASDAPNAQLYDFVAIRDHYIVKDQHDNLAAQKIDLERSADQIKDTINQLNEICSLKFLETMKAQKLVQRALVILQVVRDLSASSSACVKTGT